MKLLALNLKTEIPKTVSLSFLPFVDICAIGLFAMLFGSNYVIAPGIRIDLPRSNHVQTIHSDRLQVMSVDEIGGVEQILFEDRILNLESLSRMLEARGEVPANVTLLVRLDAAVSAQTFTSIFEIAEAAGYETIQWATENRLIEASPLGERVD